MKMIKNILLMLALSIGIGATAQKIEEEVLHYEYTKQPLSPLDGLKSYNFTVETPYPENNDALIAASKMKHDEAVADHPNVVAEAKRIHDEKVANYDDDVLLAQENFKLETEAFDKLSALEKLALEEGRPKLKMPRKTGAFVAPREPVYSEPSFSKSIVFKPNVLADTYLNVEGFSKGTESALTGTVVMEEFEMGETQRKETSKRVYNSTTKAYEEKKTYTYETPVKRPTRLILNYNDQELYNDIFGTTGEYSTTITKNSPNKFSSEKNNVGDILSAINTYINDQYGYAQVPATVVVRCPKNKGDYDDLEDAAKLAKRGINPMGSSDGKTELAEALTVWEKALSESDVDNKKARINNKVTQSLYQNLISVSLFKEEYVKAQDYLVLLGEMDLKSDEEKWVSNFTSKIETRMGN